MRAGQLRHRITVQQSVASNVGGVPSGDWEDVCTIWASVADLSGRELQAQGGIASDITTRILVRWRDDVTAQMRVLHGSRVFDIQSVIDAEGRQREMQLMAKERFEVGVGGWQNRAYSGAIDGANDTFVLATSMVAGTEFVLVNGLKQSPDAYTFDGVTLVLNSPPGAGDTLEIWGPGPGMPATPGMFKRRTYTGAFNGANTTFVLATTIPSGSEFVLWNGLKQANDTYTFNGRTLVLSVAPSAGDTLEIYG